MKFNKFLAVFWALFSVVYSSFAANIYVNSTTGTDAPGYGNAPGNAYKSVKYAYEHSVWADNIYLAAGTYDLSTEVLDVNKSVAFIGPKNLVTGYGPSRYGLTEGGNGGEAIIKSSNASYTIAITTGANTVTFRGLTLVNTSGTGAVFGGYTGYLGDKGGGANTTTDIRHCRILTNGGRGVNLDMGHSFELYYSHVAAYGYGVFLSGNVTNNLIRVKNNLIEPMSGLLSTGVYYHSASAGPAQSGSEIRDNLIRNCNFHGALVHAQSIIPQINVIGNEFRNCNAANDAGMGALSLGFGGHSNEPQLLFNKFIDCNNAIYMIDGLAGTNHRIHYNHFEGGNKVGIKNNNAGSVLSYAEVNYWGNVGDGPNWAAYNNTDGAGNAAIQTAGANVYFNGWLGVGDNADVQLTDDGLPNVGVQLPSPCTYVINDVGPSDISYYIPRTMGHAAPGDIIEFRAGWYNFSSGWTSATTPWGYTIDKNITFRGAGAGKSPSGPSRYSTDPNGQPGKETIFQWQNYYDPYGVSRTQFINVTAPDVTLEGITFKGVHDENYKIDYLIGKESSGKLTFKQNRVITTTGPSNPNNIHEVYYLLNVSCDEAVVEDNHFGQGARYGNLAFQFAYPGKKFSFVGNRIEPIGAGTLYNGIDVDLNQANADIIVVEKNVFSNYQNYGVRFYDYDNSVDKVLVRYNQLSGGSNGIYYVREVNGSLATPAVENNFFIGQTYLGLLAENYGGLLSARYNHFSGISGTIGIETNGSSGQNTDATGCVWGTAGDGPYISSNPNLTGTQNKSIVGFYKDFVAYYPCLKGTTADAVPLTFTDGGIVGAGFQLPSPATYVLDDAGPESAPNYVQKAIDIASAGDIIELRAATFNGTAMVNKNLTFAVENAATSLENLTMDGGDLTLAALTASPTLRVRTIMNFIIGKTFLGNVNLTLGAGNCLNLTELQGGSANSFIVMNETGVFTRECLGIGGIITPELFPLGATATSYTPMTVQNEATRDAYALRVAAGVLADGTSGAPFSNDVVNRTWYLSESVAGGSKLNLTAQWNGADELAFNRSSAFLRRYSGGWNNLNPATAASGSAPYTLSTTSLTATGPISVGSCTLAPPTASAPINPVCSGQSLKLMGEWSGPSAVSYLWTGPNNFSSTDANPTLSNATIAASGVYTLTVTTANGCSSSATVNVTVKQSPQTPSITVSMPLCEGQTLVFTSTEIPGAQYNWEGPHLENSTFNSTLQNPYHADIKMEDQGVYSLTVTLNGCTASAVTSYVVIRPKPATPNVYANPSTLCVGQTLTLTTDAVSQTSYSWSGPNFSSTLANPSAIVVTTANSGTYSLTTVLNNCLSDPGTVNVTVNTTMDPPIVSANPNPACVGQTLNLNGPNAPGMYYVWTGPNNFSSNEQNPTIPDVTTSASGVYSLRLMTSPFGGCVSDPGQSEYVTVTIGPATPTITVDPSVPCTGQSVAFSTPTVAGATYLWTGP